MSQQLIININYRAEVSLYNWHSVSNFIAIHVSLNINLM